MVARPGLQISLFAALIGMGQPAFAGWQDTPDSLQLQGIGDEVSINGTPMIVRGFSSPRPMEELIKQVQESWRPSDTSRGEVSRSNVATWTVLNQRVGQSHRSFQIRETAIQGTEGYVALTSPERARDPKVSIALPSDFKAVSIIDSRDQGRASQQVIATSSRSLDASLSALESTLKAAGWTRLASNKSAVTARYAANRGTQEFDATLHQQKNGSLVLMNVVGEAK